MNQVWMDLRERIFSLTKIVQEPLFLWRSNVICGQKSEHLENATSNHEGKLEVIRYSALSMNHMSARKLTFFSEGFSYSSL